MRYCFLLISLMMGLVSQSQTPPTLPAIGEYFWNVAVLMQPANVNGTARKDGAGADLPQITSLPGQKFRVVGFNSNNTLAILQILDYTSGTPGSANTKALTPKTGFFIYNYTGTATEYNNLSATEVNTRTYGNRQAYFTVPIAILFNESLVTNYVKIRGSLAAGVINFPFKYRPQKGAGDFSGAFNFGAAIGYKFPHLSHRKFTYSVLSGYSISNTVLDSSSATRNQGKLSSTNNFTAFSFSLGFMVEYERVQAGIFLGWDRISRLNNREFGWQYQGRPWLSVGFGLAIFSSQDQKSTNESSQD